MRSQAEAEKEKYNRHREEEEGGGAGRWVGVASSHTAVSVRRRLGEEEEKILSGWHWFWELAAPSMKCKWQSGDKQSRAHSSALVMEDIHMALAQAK